MDAIEHTEISPSSVMRSFSAVSIHSFQPGSTTNLNRRLLEPITYSTTAHISNNTAHDRALRLKVVHNSTIIQNASHLINLLEVTDVRPCMSKDEAGSSRYAHLTRLFSNVSNTGARSRYTNHDCCFELEMSSGVVAKFQVSEMFTMFNVGVTG